MEVSFFEFCRGFSFFFFVSFLFFPTLEVFVGLDESSQSEHLSCSVLKSDVNMNNLNKP